jgi:hypothetical protein
VRTALYSGSQGSTDNRLAEMDWSDAHTLVVNSLDSLAPGEAITLQADYPAGIVAPYVPGFWEKYGAWLLLLLPAVLFVFLWRYWRRVGKDPAQPSALAPEFGPPQNLAPLELGVVEGYGKPADRFFAATLVSLASKGYLKITQVEGIKVPLLGALSQDYQITLERLPDSDLREFERVMLNGLFTSSGSILVAVAELTGQSTGSLQVGQSVLLKAQRVALTELKPKVFDAAKKGLPLEKYVDPQGINRLGGLLVVAVLGAWGGGFLLIQNQDIPLGLAIAIPLVCGVITAVFAFLMPRRTPEGAQLFYQIKGFRLYMKKAETYRQQFNEKEDIFDRLLPYAIGFGLATQWASAMARLYPDRYGSGYVPLWYLGVPGSSFSADSFGSQMQSLSQAVGAASQPQENPPSRSSPFIISVGCGQPKSAAEQPGLVLHKLRCDSSLVCLKIFGFCGICGPLLTIWIVLYKEGGGDVLYMRVDEQDTDKVEISSLKGGVSQRCTAYLLEHAEGVIEDWVQGHEWVWYVMPNTFPAVETLVQVSGEGGVPEQAFWLWTNIAGGISYSLGPKYAPGFLWGIYSFLGSTIGLADVRSTVYFLPASDGAPSLLLISQHTSLNLEKGLGGRDEAEQAIQEYVRASISPFCYVAIAPTIEDAEHRARRMITAGPEYRP